jgi:hypothetical protein
MALVALRHQVERELMRVAARTVSDDDSQQTIISSEDYRQRLAELQRQKNPWECVIKKLHLTSCKNWSDSMRTLQLLSNCFKHEPTQQPDQKLIEHLKSLIEHFKPEAAHIVGYASLSESQAFQKLLASSIKLPEETDYCTIADTFVTLVEQFWTDVQRKNNFARVVGKVSLTKFLA